MGLFILEHLLTNITFVVSIQNTNVANTLVMIATAPMISAILGAIFLKEPDNMDINNNYFFGNNLYFHHKIRKFLW